MLKTGVAREIAFNPRRVQRAAHIHHVDAIAAGVRKFRREMAIDENNSARIQVAERKLLQVRFRNLARRLFGNVQCESHNRLDVREPPFLVFDGRKTLRDKFVQRRSADDLKPRRIQVGGQALE